MIDENVGLHLVETWDDAQEFMAWLGQRRSVMAVDTETSGFDWWRGNLRLVQFGDTTAGWAIPFERWVGLITQVLEDYDGPIVFHNAKFDLHWLEAHGIKVKRHLVHDTSVMVGLLEPLKFTALKNAASRWIDHRAAAGQEELKRAMAKAKWTWGTIPPEFEGYWVYSALDAVLTAHLYEKLWPLVEVEYRTVYDIEMRCVRILGDMETRGARVDLDYCAQQQVHMLDYAQQARKWVEDTYGFEAGQNKLVAAQLMRDGIILTEKTDSGAWSTKAEVLEVIDHPLAETVLRIRRTEKIANSYFANFADLAEGDIIHPGVRPMGAKTGRMSVADPSMQNLPRGRVVRDAFIAREGHTLLGVDYSQIEFRLMAHFSQDPGLIRAFDGEDFFMLMAQTIYNDPTITKDDPRRQVTKTSMYAKAFMSGVDQFARTAGITPGEARQFMAMLDNTFPGMRTFSQDIIAQGQRRMASEGEAFVKTVLGRRVVVDRSGKEYKLVNGLIQGTAADLLKQVICELDDAGVAQYIIMPIHDELIFDIPDEDLDEVADVVSNVMTRDEFRVPFTVDPHTGQKMGDLK